jgi:hypothetical protein
MEQKHFIFIVNGPNINVWGEKYIIFCIVFCMMNFRLKKAKNIKPGSR